MNRTLFILVVLLCFNNVYAQDATGFSDDNSGLQNSRNQTRPFGVAAGMGYSEESSTYTLTASADYFFTKWMGTEVAYCNHLRDIREQRYSAGVRFAYMEGICRSGLTPFVGLDLIYFRFMDGTHVGDGNIIWERDCFLLPDIPLGIRYTTRFGLQASLRLRYFFIFDSYRPKSVELSVGWRFNFRKRG